MHKPVARPSYEPRTFGYLPSVSSRDLILPQTCLRRGVFIAEPRRLKELSLDGIKDDEVNSSFPRCFRTGRCSDTPTSAVPSEECGRSTYAFSAGEFSCARGGGRATVRRTLLNTNLIAHLMLNRKFELISFAPASYRTAADCVPHPSKLTRPTPAARSLASPHPRSRDFARDRWSPLRHPRAYALRSSFQRVV